jgi:hypothetical protein
MVYNNKVILSILALIIFACTKSEPLEENPLDPDAGDYEVPSVVIKSNIQPGETITSETINIALEGNDLVIEYRLRLDESEWTEWSSESSFTLDYLDEGNHTIYGQARYVSSDESEIMSLPFTVDAVDGPSLIFFPRRHKAATGQTVTYQVLAEEVYNLAGAEFVLDYNPSKLVVEAVREGTLFSSVGTPIFFYEIDPGVGKLTITAAAWAGDELGFTGTGVIAEIDAVLAQNGNTTIDFDGDEIFRNPDNTTINISEAVGGFMTNP